MPDNKALLSILIITLLAAFVPLLAARLKRYHVPVVICEILAGVLIGKSILDIVHPSPVLKFLSEFGFVILMFISGLEIDVNSLSFAGIKARKWNFWRAPIFLALLSFALTLACSYAIADKFSHWGLIENPVIIALILSTTSLGIVVPVLKERGIISSDYGQTILLAALFADLATLVLLSLALGMVTRGIGLQLMIFMVLLVFFSVMIGMGLHAKGIPGLNKILEGLTTSTVQIRTRFSIALMVTWVALSRALGTEVILGAFLAGVIMSIMADHDKEALKDKLDTLGFGFFIPVFFITVGSEFDVRSFFGSLDAIFLLPLLLGAAYAVKALPALVYWPAFTFRESMAAGFLLSSRLSLIIAASTLALRLGLINEAVNADILMLAMATCMLSPILFNKTAPRVAEIKRKGYIIVGFNQHTAHLIDRLAGEGEDVKVIQSLRDSCPLAYCEGAIIVKGNPEDEKTLREVGADTAAGLVTIQNNRETDAIVCRLAREKFGIPVVVTRADDQDFMEKMKAIGVRVVQPSLATAIALEGALRYPVTFDMIAQQKDGMELGEAVLLNYSYDSLSVNEIRLPGNALIMGIRRDGNIIVPHGDTVLAVDDVVMLVGNPESIRETKESLERGTRGHE